METGLSLISPTAKHHHYQQHQQHQQHRRRMSANVSALDLELQTKRRTSFEVDPQQQQQKKSTAGAGPAGAGGGHHGVSHGGGQHPTEISTAAGGYGRSAAGWWIGDHALNQGDVASMAYNGATGGGVGGGSYWPMTSTQQIMTKHNYKGQLSGCLNRMDHAFSFMNASSAGTRWKESVLHGLRELNEAIDEAWKNPMGADLSAGMADHLRSTFNLDVLCRMFIEDKLQLRLQAGRTIENYLSDRNRDYIVQQSWFKDFLSLVLYDASFDDCDNKERHRLSASLLDSFIRHGAETCAKVMDRGGLDFLLRVCKLEWECGDQLEEDAWETLRDIGSAMCNLAVLGGREARQAMVDKNMPTWMFVLLSHQDKRTRFYACLVVGVIANERDFQAAVDESQTLQLVETFLQTNKPADMAPLDLKYKYGRPKAWLSVMASMLRSPRSEVQALACFQLTKEAYIRRNKENGLQALLQILDEVGATTALKEIVGAPSNQLATGFAEELLKLLGESLPKKLSQNVPLWTAEDVEFWVKQIGFDDYASKFAQYRVDGDLLLRTTDRLLINEIEMKSEYERMRFMRELTSLKRSADYNCVDSTRLDMWMMGLDRDLSMYTYEMLLNGIDRRTLIHVDENILTKEGGICNAVHRMKVLHAIKEVKHVDELDIALLRKSVDIFICYRRSTGSQLASLLKVHLQLRGYKVFIDVDRLYAGQFDTSLLKNIRAAKHFLLVLTPHALDRCVDDQACKDWVHLEIRTALEFGRNIVPVQDKGFVWPEVSSLPNDIRPIAFFNAVQWVHEYQEACVEKLDKFIKGEHGTSNAANNPDEDPSHVTTGAGQHAAASSTASRASQGKLTVMTNRAAGAGKIAALETAPALPPPLFDRQISELSALHKPLKRSATTAARMDSA